jgi:hypothetical protein
MKGIRPWVVEEGNNASEEYKERGAAAITTYLSNARKLSM